MEKSNVMINYNRKCCLSSTVVALAYSTSSPATGNPNWMYYVAVVGRKIACFKMQQKHENWNIFHPMHAIDQNNGHTSYVRLIKLHSENKLINNLHVSTAEEQNQKYFKTNKTKSGFWMDFTFVANSIHLIVWCMDWMPL